MKSRAYKVRLFLFISPLLLIKNNYLCRQIKGIQ